MLTMSTASTEYIKVPVQARISGAVVDPTSDTVNLAVIAPTAKPGDDDWLTGSWETDDGVTYLARTLVTAGAFRAGTYAVWVKVAHTPETVVRRSGLMRFN